MPNLAQSLAQSLSQSLAQSLGGASLPFSLLTFERASDAYLINPITGAVVGPFASGVPVISVINGKSVLLNEQSKTNHCRYSNTLPSWSLPTKITRQDPQASPDPLSTNTAEQITETATTGYHGIDDTALALSETLTSGVFIKRYAASTRWVRIATGAPLTNWYDPVNKVWGTLDPSSSFHFNRAVSNGFNYIGCTGTAAGAVYFIHGLTNADGYGGTYLGVITEGVYLFQVDLQSGPYLTSPIVSAGAPTTRPKSQAYYNVAILPSAFRNRMLAYFYPEYSSAQLAACAAGSKRHIWTFCDSGTNRLELYLLSTDQKFYLDLNGVTLDASAAGCTWSADQPILPRLDRPAGKVYITGLTTGDDTLSFTPPAASDGHLIWGAYDTGDILTMSNQCDGFLTPPESW